MNMQHNLFVKNAHLPSKGHTNLHIEKGIITKMGSDLAPPDSSFHNLNAEGRYLIPGLVNGHCHAAMVLFRGFGDDMPLMEWLENCIWPAEAKLTEEDVYWGTRLACLEMIRSGTTYFFDMYWHSNAVARAVEDSGMRGMIGQALIDISGPEQGQRLKDSISSQYEKQSQQSHSRITYSLAPHSIYTVSSGTLRWAADFAKKHQLPLQIHLSETEYEVQQCLKNFGKLPALYLDSLGVLTPETILSHGVHLADQELDLISERGSILVTNPVSNMKIAVGGSFPYVKAKERSIPMLLGTDGAASNNSLDLFQDMKTFALLQKHQEKDPTVLPAEEVYSIATGSKALSLGPMGVIKEGAKADFLLMTKDQAEILPEHDFISNLVYSTTGREVDTVVIDGKIVMENRKMTDEAIIYEQVKKRAQSFFA